MLWIVFLESDFVQKKKIVKIATEKKIVLRIIM